MSFKIFLILLILCCDSSGNVFDLSFSQSPKNNTSDDKWFLEPDLGLDFTDLSTPVKVESILHQSQSKYQDILVFNNKLLGNVLALAGIIQLSDWDEYAYHEMAAHLPLFAHPNPKNVLIIGGGDGGVAREVLKHSTIEKVVMVEIDEGVVNASRDYFPVISVSLNHPKLRVQIGDGFAFLRKCGQRARAFKLGQCAGNLSENCGNVSDPDIPQDGMFDLILTDSSEMDQPGSPNEALFGQEYYTNIHDALRPPHGLLSSLVGTYWLYKDLHQQVNLIIQKIFPSHRFASFSVPSWTTGLEGLIVASLDPNANLEMPHFKRMKDLNSIKFRYYNRDMHEAAFAIPQFYRKKLKIKSEDN